MMRKFTGAIAIKLLQLFVFCLLSATVFSQQHTENIVIVTLDGLRWQELFKGADDSLVNSKEFDHDIDVIKKSFWATSEEERREKLFPFIWKTVAKQGQLYGNRAHHNYMDVANPFWVSYPGYSEMFTGYVDTNINSNKKIYNPNENVLEFINKQPGYQGKVAAFTTWDVFPYILNAPRSGIYVNADVDSLRFDTPTLKLVNDMQFLTTRPIAVRPDVFTYFAAREYLKAYKPRLLYISFDETDDFAHRGLYDQYLKAAYAEDQMIADLWKILQSTPGYAGKTTLIITCDHGRGDQLKYTWTSHGSKIVDAHETWMAVIGPDTKPEGEIKRPMQLYQQQLAGTIAALLGLKFTTTHPVANGITSVMP